MTNKQDKQVFLIVTQEISKPVLKLYNRISAAVGNTSDVFILFHSKRNIVPKIPQGVKVDIFTNDILSSMGYTPIRSTLVPGSNHFPILKFFLEHPQYDHYWCIEDDVVFNGNWIDFFNSVPFQYDFVTSHIRSYKDQPKWFWWNTYKVPGEESPEYTINSFNPTYRISASALSYIDQCLKKGYQGHHEVLLPSLLFKAGYQLADLGSVDNRITPHLSLCTLTSMRWRPVFLRPGDKKNILYHPVKPNLNLKQFVDLIKRTVRGEKDYLVDNW